MKPARMEALADSIFAFAMTILVLSINLPDGAKSVDVGAYILAQRENFWNFALSFFLLAVFWLGHSQQYHHIRKTDSLTLWLNILMLLFVVLIPFSTSLMSDYPDDLTAEVFFNFNLLVLSLLAALNWWHAFREGLIEVQGSSRHLAMVSRKVLLMPAVSLSALLIAFLSPGWSTLAYLAIPLFLYFPRRA